MSSTIIAFEDHTKLRVLVKIYKYIYKVVSKYLLIKERSGGGSDKNSLILYKSLKQAGNFFFEKEAGGKSN